MWTRQEMCGNLCAMVTSALPTYKATFAGYLAGRGDS